MKPNPLVAKDREVVKMELRGVQVPIMQATEHVSAHQFSQRSFSQQADSEERQEIFIETALIDLKNEDSEKIDIYELGGAQKTLSSNQKNSKSLGIRQVADMQVGTEANRNLLSSRDWFFSDIHRIMLLDFYERTGQPLT